jgi:SAM-dependent methyltransferase
MEMNAESVTKKVRERYGSLAAGRGNCCGTSGSTLDHEGGIGYDVEELKSIPEDAVMGLGCGNPVALASLREGERVLDLGSGAGIDCFLAARKVGRTGRVIGVDMTPEMLERARENARKGGFDNVEFRLGEIENLPVGDERIDVIISNCVVNLSVDKERVFSEAHRVLRPGGRLMISDIVLTKEIPARLRNSISGYVGCISGALLREEYLGLIEKAGFADVRVVSDQSFAGGAGEDGLGEEIMSELGVTREELARMLRATRSIRVQAGKTR